MQDETALQENWSRPRPRRANVMLRDGRLFEADIYANEGEVLPQVLASRQRFVNFTRVRWLNRQAPLVDHMAVRLDRILWVRGLGEDLPLSRDIARPRLRPVRLQLEDGTALRGELLLAYEHRISDYFDNANEFVPLFDVEDVATRDILGDVAMNQSAIVAVVEEK